MSVCVWCAFEPIHNNLHSEFVWDSDFVDSCLLRASYTSYTTVVLSKQTHMPVYARKNSFTNAGKDQS